MAEERAQFSLTDPDIEDIVDGIGPHVLIRDIEESEEDYNVIVYPPQIGTVQHELQEAERALDDIEAEMVSVEVVERMLHRVHAAYEKENG